MRTLSGSLVAVLLAACNPAPTTTASGSSAPAAESAALAVGDPAPDVSLKLQDGKEVQLSSLKGKAVLVYFYPKDDTPGCTVEAKGIRDEWAAFQKAGIEVYGVSSQDAGSHQAFIDKYDLPFPLVVDSDGAVAKAFKVPTRLGYASRQSFLIGKDGKLKAVWLDVNPSEHAAAVLAAAAS